MKTLIYFFKVFEFNSFSMFVLTCNFYADNPQEDPNVSGDPYKTLFVARLVSDIVFVLWIFQLVPNFLFEMIYYSCCLLAEL